MTQTPAPDPTPASSAPAEAEAKLGFRWVPIRPLAARHRQRILTHLLSLDDADRYLRFGSVAGDAQIAHYVEQMDFERDEVFGIFNRQLTLLAVAHLAFGTSGTRTEDAHPSAEFGVSVLPHARGRGYGSHLFERAVLYARNRGIERLIIHALSENKAMLAIARKAGATVVREGSESQAELQLPPDDVGSRVEQFVGDTVGELDFRLKAQARAVGNMLTTLSEVKAEVMALGEDARAEAAELHSAHRGAAASPATPHVAGPAAPQVASHSPAPPTVPAAASAAPKPKATDVVRRIDDKPRRRRAPTPR